MQHENHFEHSNNISEFERLSCHESDYSELQGLSDSDEECEKKLEQEFDKLLAQKTVNFGKQKTKFESPANKNDKP